MADEACACAQAARVRQLTLQRHALGALRWHVRWVHALHALHATHLAAAAWRSWRQHAAAAAHRARLRDAGAGAHAQRRLQQRALQAWQRGTVVCKRERLVEQRREQRWATVERYLVEHRAAKAAAGTAGAAGAAWKQPGGGGGGGRGSTEATPPSSAENSAWDPNTLFAGGPGPGHGF